ncbi:hypothetical protein H6P81_000169 [Aristolochia fimbriata]|uniref:LOB domain-containing protein n=1 Tax=Aristolochia fimbriata TaxID=158543 RepID=A0AAV7F4K7_ARIFI|nr:hypothetical protein H6P81_000169 [Aristolochia fimbriata]
MSKNETGCAACKLQSRACGSECPLRPYFPGEVERMEEYERLQRVFRPDYVRKVVDSVGPPLRDDAVKSLVFEAEAWRSDPVHGCLGSITHLQNNIRMLEMELQAVQRQLRLFRTTTPTIDEAAAGIIGEGGCNITNWSEELCAAAAKSGMHQASSMTTQEEEEEEEEDPDHRHHLELFSPRQDAYCNNN